MQHQIISILNNIFMARSESVSSYGTLCCIDKYQYMNVSLRLAKSAGGRVNRRRGAQQFRCNYDMKNSKAR